MFDTHLLFASSLARSFSSACSLALSIAASILKGSTNEWDEIIYFLSYQQINL